MVFIQLLAQLFREKSVWAEEGQGAVARAKPWLSRQAGGS
jgi:hypothetical protein